MAKIATVTSITGKAFAISADGKIRELKLGDEIEKGEIIQTAASGRVELQMVDGQAFAVAPEQLIKLDENVAQEQGEQRPTAKEATVAPSTADEVIQALERGGDLTEQLEATAAGAGGGGGGGQGNAGFVRLLRISEGIDPIAYEYQPPEFGTTVSITGEPALAPQPITIKIFAVDVVDAETGTYVIRTTPFAEGETAHYVALPVDDAGNPIQIDIPAGTVQITFTQGSANEGSDYTPQATLTVSLGEIFTADIVNDVYKEDPETYTLEVSGFTAAADFASVTYINGESEIVDFVDTTKVGLTNVGLSANKTIDENGDTITYTATLSNPVRAEDPAVTVTFTDLLGKEQTITIQPVGSALEGGGISDGLTGTVKVVVLESKFEDVYKEDDATLGVLTAADLTVAGGNFEKLEVGTVDTGVTLIDTIDTTTVSVTVDDTPIVVGQDGITFNFQLSNPPQADSGGGYGSLTVEVGTKTYTVDVDSAGAGSLTIETNDPNYVAGQNVTATVISINGGNFEKTSVDGASATEDLPLALGEISASLDIVRDNADSGHATLSGTGPEGAVLTVRISGPDGVIEAFNNVQVGENGWSVTPAGTYSEGVTYIANAEGTYTVTDDDGDSSTINLVAPPSSDSLPVVTLTADLDIVRTNPGTPGSAGTATLSGTSTGTVAGDTVTWSISNGSTTVASGTAIVGTGGAWSASPTGTYTEGVTYTVNASVTSTGGVDTDTDTATATDSDSLPVVTVAYVNGDVVDEKGLNTGTGELADSDPDNDSDNTETATGSFTINIGGDTLSKLEVWGSATSGGTASYQDVTGSGSHTIYGTNGVLTVTNTSGVYTWSYTLTNNLPHGDTVTSDGDGISGVADQITGEAFKVLLTGQDGDTDTSTLDITVNDDSPIPVISQHAVLTNGDNNPVEVTGFELDLDTNLLNNYGADQSGATVRFDASLVASGFESGLTSNGTKITYTITSDGHTLNAWAGSVSVFTITLDPENGTYSIDMNAQVDSTRHASFASDNYNFVGGNSDWAGFIPLTDDSVKACLLLTPEINDRWDGTINSSALSGGVADAASVGAGETFRIDFVYNLSGDPKSTGSGDYDTASKRDHVFDGHYSTNGASAVFTATSGSVVKFGAFQDPDGDSVVGAANGDADPGAVAISGIAISYNGDTHYFDLSPTGDPQRISFSVGGRVFTVQEFEDKTVNVEGVYSDSATKTQVAVYTNDPGQYNALEYSYVSGDTFKLGDFGAATPSDDPVSFNLPIQVVDGDGDTASSLMAITLTDVGETIHDLSLATSGQTATANATDGLHILGSAYGDTLNGDGDANVLLGNAGDDTLTGNAGNDTLDGGAGVDILYGGDGGDLLIGGAGNDAMTGGLGADVFQWKLGDQGATTTPALDTVMDFNVAQKDVLDLRDLLQGEHSSSGTNNLTKYLQFGVESGKLVLSVDHDGGDTFAADQKIVLNNFASKADLATALGISTTSDDSTIINKMITEGHLKTDA